MQLDRSAIYEGETFHYQLMLSDSSPLDDALIPDISSWTDFDVHSFTKQPVQMSGSSFSVTIINGRTVRDNRSATYSTQFNYVLTPKRAGTLAIPLPKVTVNGLTLSPQTFAVAEGERQLLADYSVAVQVIEPEEQDIVFLSMEVNRDRLYPLQPLEITLVIHIKGLLDRYAAVNPLTLLAQPPQLQIPWAERNVKGFLPSQPLENWLTNLVVRPPQQRGFAINDYATSGMGFDTRVNRLSLLFSMDDLLQRVPYQFSGSPRQIQRPDAQGNETTYWEYRFSRTFIPQEFGNYSFGPVTLKGALPVIIQANAPDGLTAKRIYAVAKPITVAVVDVPQANCPVDYIGAFGAFRWDATLTPQQARVGDPMTLTLRLLGQGSMANVRPLDLSSHPDVSTNFRVHMPPTEEMSEQSCTFTYTIRPLNPGTIEFPSIPVSVFDVNMERFVSLSSLPIPLNIANAESIQSPTLFGSVPDGNVQLLEGGLFANKTTLSQTFPPITFAQWALTVSCLTAGYAAMALGVLLWRCQWTNPKRQRQRGALSRAKSRLATLSSALRGGKNLIEISSELSGVFFGYIADRWDKAEQGMTTNDACQHLRDNRVPESLIGAIKAALESLDAVKYGGMDMRSLDELAGTALTLLQQLDRER